MKVEIMYKDRNQYTMAEMYGRDHEHREKIRGKNAAECMEEITWKRINHDLAIYTPIEITWIED